MFTSMANVDLAGFAPQSLFYDANEQTAAMVAECRLVIGVVGKYVAVLLLVVANRTVGPHRAFEPNKLVASLVNGDVAGGALMTLLVQTPDEIGAMGAKGWLVEKGRNKVVAF
jgi:hypothetical protein